MLQISRFRQISNTVFSVQPSRFYFLSSKSLSRYSPRSHFFSTKVAQICPELSVSKSDDRFEIRQLGPVIDAARLSDSGIEADNLVAIAKNGVSTAEIVLQRLAAVEEKCSQLEKENSHLKEENIRLKEAFIQLERENSHLKEAFIHSERENSRLKEAFNRLEKDYYGDQAILLADQLFKFHQKQLIMNTFLDSRYYRLHFDKLTKFDHVARAYRSMMAKKSMTDDEATFCRIYEEKEVGKIVSPLFEEVSLRRSAIAHPIKGTLEDALFVLGFMEDGRVKEVAISCARLHYEK
jgi:hypothetical protein